MVQDELTNEPFRVDHLLKSEFEKMLKKQDSEKIKSLIQKIDSNQFKVEEIESIIEENKICS